MPELTILAAKPASKKTTVIKFELYKGTQLKIYNYTIIFCGNSDDEYEKIIDGDFIYYIYSDKTLARILRFQKQKISEGNPLKLLLIFDDIIRLINFNSPLIKILITKYRHFNLA
jgi:hypothetical protein